MTLAVGKHHIFFMLHNNFGAFAVKRACLSEYFVLFVGKFLKTSSENELSPMKRTFLLTLALCSALWVSAQIPKAEKQVLEELYYATRGVHWVHKWDLNKPVNEWYGVSLQGGHVVGLELFHNNLKGTLPESIGKLPDLEVLNLAFNNLTGQLPHTVFDLKELRILKIEMNRLKGEVPESIAGMSKLIEFSAFNNFLSGRIPSGIGQLESLEILNLSSNSFYGRIPESIGSLRRLESLGLFENQLYGDIPESIGELSALKELVLANNRLGGAIPESFGRLASLEILQIQHNNFDSYNNLGKLNTRQLLVFDYDVEKSEIDYRNLEFSRTRMADTKFEDDNDK